MSATSALDPVAATRQARLDLCDHLERLTDEEWSVPSLCPGWTVKDVVAHLTTSTRTTLKDVAVGMVRARGDFDRMEMSRALAIAERSTPAELIDQIRQTAGSAARAPFSSPLDPLVDILVHSQDICRPLGHSRSMDVDVTAAALDHVVTSRWYGARRRLEGLHLTATDGPWTYDAGELPVTGPIADLLLVATGRSEGLSGVEGPGVRLLTQRLFAS